MRAAGDHGIKPAPRGLGPCCARCVPSQRAPQRGGRGRPTRHGSPRTGLSMCEPQPIRFELQGFILSKTNQELLEAAEKSMVHTFGWPIGVLLSNKSPRSLANEIVTEIPREDDRGYDYWALRNTGDFYQLQSLFEDERKPGRFF